MTTTRMMMMPVQAVVGVQRPFPTVVITHPGPRK